VSSGRSLVPVTVPCVVLNAPLRYLPEGGPRCRRANHIRYLSDSED
jgi:hypothetical protein